jgi:hypothetical protein
MKLNFFFPSAGEPRALGMLCIGKHYTLYHRAIQATLNVFGSVLGFEVRASYLLGGHSTTCAIPPALLPYVGR